MLFRCSSVITILVHIIQVFYTVLLFRLLKQYHKTAAILMLVLSLLGISIALLNELNLFAVLAILKNATFNKDQSVAATSFLLNIHQSGILIAQIFWGLWLFPLGYLTLKTRTVPKIIGALLLLAGLGYTVDSFGGLIMDNYSMGLARFTFIGELLFTLWLIIKGLPVKSDNLIEHKS